MNHNRRKIATIFLLSLVFMSFSIRHVVVDDDCLDAQAIVEYTIDAPDYSYSFEKIPVYALVIAAVAAVLPARYITICVPLYKAVRRSHIEYCGRKMVKAIMLQFRPN